MTEYTPTTEEVRGTYTWGASACGCCAEYRDEDYEKFDRWLAALIREAKAEALDETAEEFMVNTWREVLKPAGGMPGLSRNAYSVGEYLLARAAEYRKAVQS